MQGRSSDAKPQRARRPGSENSGARPRYYYAIPLREVLFLLSSEALDRCNNPSCEPGKKIYGFTQWENGRGEAMKRLATLSSMASRKRQL